jgi:hypothetical protein
MEPFTHVYCDNCDDIQPVQRNRNVTCGVCGSVAVKMDDSGRGYCEICQQMQPLEHEPLAGEDVSGQFLGGDILCSDCRFVITTVFIGESHDEAPDRIPEATRRACGSVGGAGDAQRAGDPRGNWTAACAGPRDRDVAGTWYGRRERQGHA